MPQSTPDQQIMTKPQKGIAVYMSTNSSITSLMAVVPDLGELSNSTQWVF